MDPNANLAEQRRIIARFMADKASLADAERLAELAEALDGWLSAGGFLPEAWQRRPLCASPGNGSGAGDDRQPTTAREAMKPVPMIPAPVSRGEFEILLDDRMRAREALRQIEISITFAKARTVEPVTRENLLTEWSMLLGKRARHEGKAAVEKAVEAWHRHQDEAALEIVIAALNAEAGA